MIVIQAALLVDVQLQPEGAVTVTAPVLLAATAFADVGEMVGMHDVPTCVIVKVLPAMVIVPVRDVLLGFAATTKVTVPLPLPVPVPLIVIHGSFETAVQVQPVAAVTLKLLVTPPAATLAEFGEMDGEHGAAA